MKISCGMAIVMAVTAMSLAAIDSADARGPRGAGNVSMGNIQIGPRVTAPVIRPGRLGPRQFPRQISGPRESARGINCYWVSFPAPRYFGVRCPQRI